MMRLYELVERVTKYDPEVDEDLLNRAYIYAMKAHGSQRRASGEARHNPFEPLPDPIKGLFCPF